MALREIEEYYVDLSGVKLNILKDWRLNPLSTDERILLGESLDNKHVGLPVYDTEHKVLYFWTGDEWQGTGGEGNVVVVDGDGIGRIYNEVPTGHINGVNLTYTTIHSYMPNTTRVYINGVRQIKGQQESFYEFADKTIRFTEAPFEGAKITIDYDTQTQI